MPRAPLALLTALLAAIALTACGGSGSDPPPTKADFATQYAPISAEIRDIGADIGSAVTSAKNRTDAVLQTEFGLLAKRTSAAASLLKTSEPPDDAAIKSARDKLIAGVKQGASDLAAISTAASLHDAEAAKAATIKLSEDAVLVSVPRKQLDKLVLTSD